MKKYLLLLAGLLCFIAYGELNAKAYKLGRHDPAVVHGNTNIAAGSGGGANIVQCPTGCEKCNSNTNCVKCKSGYYLRNGFCIVCPANATCTATSFSCKVGYYLRNGVCVACPANATCAGGSASFVCDSGYRLTEGVRCESNCTNVNCLSGYVPTRTALGCCCELGSCPSGQRKSGNVCVSNCSGVSCLTGYTPTVTSSGCCCNATAIANCQTQNGATCSRCKYSYLLQNNKCVACPANATCTGTSSFTCNTGYKKNAAGTACVDQCGMQVWHPVLNKCVTPVCPLNCKDISCASQGYCTECENGYYLNNSGTCSTCSSAISNCTRCTRGGSGSGGLGSGTAATCTACASGYSLSNGKCVKKTCPQYKVYHPILDKCVDAVCPSDCADMCSGGYCASCNPGYTLNSNGGCSVIGVSLPPDPCEGSTDGTPAFCSNGLIRVPGKGCCPTSMSPSQQCLQCATKY